MKSDDAPAPTPASQEWNPLAGTRVVPGQAVVVGMAAFALLMTSAMFLYWELYTRPFRPLQTAIAAKYKGSSPRAVGGKYKSHLAASPAILRLIVRVAWDPRQEEARARRMANDLVDIARQNVPLEQYDRVEIFLMHRRPEQLTITWSVDAPVTAYPLPEAGPLEGPDVRRRVTEGVEGT